MRSWFSLSRSDNDEAIQILAQAIWIASLTLAVTGHSRLKNGVASPTYDRWSMLTCGGPSDRCMDGRVKPGQVRP
jgi:hypothetical protein